MLEWLVFFAFFFYVLISIGWHSWAYGITPTPTSTKVKKLVLKILPSEVKGKIVELGSGWGHLTLSLARHYPDNVIEAYEISPIPYSISYILNLWKQFSNLKLIKKDFFKISLDGCGLIVCYLYPGAMEKLKVKFEKELAPGTFIVSHTFAIPGWVPLKLMHANDLYHTPVYLYQIKKGCQQAGAQGFA
ncbi:MAG: methyltransferase [Candidatus Protochlamydia sp.]|nr:methyltransferase [Candidatus Protochlamydia sp.]